MTDECEKLTFLSHIFHVNFHSFFTENGVHFGIEMKTALWARVDGNKDRYWRANNDEKYVDKARNTRKYFGVRKTFVHISILRIAGSYMCNKIVRIFGFFAAPLVIHNG